VSVLERENQRLRQELDKLKRQMETGVEARTLELTAANAQLAKEVEERTQVEQTLRESEQRLSTVLNGILTGVLIIDGRTHHIVDANPHAAEIVGLPKDQIVGRVCHQFVCPAEVGSCPISDLRQTVDRSERVLLKADGARIPILKTVVSVTWQGQEYLVESFVDISRLKQAEQEVKESLSLLEATLESTANGLLVVDPEGRIKHYNRQFQELWQIPNAVLAERNDDQVREITLSRVKDPQAYRSRVRELYDHPESEGLDTLELIDGRIVERCSKPQILGDRIVGRVWSFHDITEKTLAQQKQAALLRKVADINEELTHFAYVVSHDLKAPLRGIKLVTEWLCADYGDKLGDDAKEQLDLLQSRVARMHNLIDGVLQYSRIGRITEEATQVDLTELIAGIVDGIAPPAHVHVTVEGPLPTLSGEKTRITQVFQNLLANAVKFMDKPVGEVRIGCVEDGEFWRFHVADNGPGIEEKYFDRIFRLFQTLAPRDEFESTGVGLALVKKIVERYGGRVWVESEVGRGSTFFVSWPKEGRVVQAEPGAVEVAG